MKSPYAYLIVAVLSLALGGCALTPESVEAPLDRRVTLAADLARDVLVSNIRCVRGEGGYLHFQAEAVNRTTADCGVEWRIAWLDASGLEIESVAATWRKLMIPPQDIVALASTAPNPAAVDFRFYVRKLRR